MRTAEVRPDRGAGRRGWVRATGPALAVAVVFLVVSPAALVACVMQAASGSERRAAGEIGGGPSAAVAPPASVSMDGTMIAIGVARHEMRLVVPGEAQVYRFQEPLWSLVIAHANTRITASYGSTASTGFFSPPELRMAELSIDGGWRIGLPALELAALHVKAFIPIRLVSWYRYVGIGESALVEPPPNRHVIESTLSLGGGLLASAARGRLGFRVQAATGAGAVAAVAAHETGDARLARTTDFVAELRVLRLLGGRRGLAIGYQYEMHRWSDVPFADSAGWTDGLLHPGTLPRRRGRALMYAGVVF